MLVIAELISCCSTLFRRRDSRAWLYCSCCSLEVTEQCCLLSFVYWSLLSLVLLTGARSDPSRFLCFGNAGLKCIMSKIVLCCFALLFQKIPKKPQKNLKIQKPILSPISRLALCVLLEGARSTLHSLIVVFFLSISLLYNGWAHHRGSPFHPILSPHPAFLNVPSISPTLVSVEYHQATLACFRHLPSPLGLAGACVLMRQAIPRLSIAGEPCPLYHCMLSR